MQEFENEIWFSGEEDFLSNFYPAYVTYNGITYPNSECAFQAQKILDANIQKEFSLLTNPRSAKSKGRKVPLRYDWEDVKYNIMEEIVRAKFTQNPQLKKQLLDTGNKQLQERRKCFPDKVWGMTLKGVGENRLGKILMKIRSELVG